MSYKLCCSVIMTSSKIGLPRWLVVLVVAVPLFLTNVVAFSLESNTRVETSHLRRAVLKGSSDFKTSNINRNDTNKKNSNNYIKHKHNHKQRNNKNTNSNPKHTSKRRGMAFRAAKAFNTKVTTQCHSASEILALFMEHTSKMAGETITSTKISAVTHLAGANQVNSINFSTSLHRLARFASYGVNGRSYTSSDQQSPPRKETLSDPRFALFLCSLAEMAASCSPDLSVKQGNDLMVEWTTAKRTLGNTVREREEKTRVAKEVMDRLNITHSRYNAFSMRECSNICWALAKLQVVPPYSAFPLGRVLMDQEQTKDSHHTQNSHDHDHFENSILTERQFHSLEEMSLDVFSSSMQIRMLLLEEARKRTMGENNAGSGGASSWIPELSRLAGKLMDLFAVQITREYTIRRAQNDSNNHHNEDQEGHGAVTIDRYKHATFNSMEMASLLWAFAKSQRADEPLFSAVAEELTRQTESMRQIGSESRPKPQEASNTIWAFATTGIRGEAQVKLVKLMADALDEGSGEFFGYYFKPQELANSAWALATLHSKRSQTEENRGSPHIAPTNIETTEDDGVVRILRWVAKTIKKDVSLFKPQELSNSVWAFSTVGFGYDESSGTNAHNEYTHVTTDSPIEDKALVFDTLEIIAENALPRLGTFKAQELNNLAWGFARLGHRSERAENMLKGIAGQMKLRLYQFKPQDIGTSLWSLATAECHDFEAFRDGASRLNFQQIRLFKPQEMSNAVWALATAGFAPQYIHAFDTTLVPAGQRPTFEDIKKDPITECFAAVASETMRRPHEFKVQELKDVLWSFSRIGVRHPSLFKRIAEHISGINGRGFSGFSSQGLGNSLWSFAKQAQLSLDVIETLGDSVKVGTTGRLAVYETSCLDIGEDLIKRFFTQAAEGAIEVGLDRFKIQDISNTCWAYAILGVLHSGLFKQVEKQLILRMNSPSTKVKQSFKAQEFANLLWAYATLNAQPEPTMIDTMGSCISSLCSGKNGSDEYSIARLFKRQELSNIAWSCAVFGRYPKDLMKTLYLGIFGNQNDPGLMKKVFEDEGLHKSSIMTLYYVQFAIDVEASHLKLSLPNGFPLGWSANEAVDSKASTERDKNDLVQASSSMLTLTVSKLQTEVSKTFTQLGFDNTLEHVIDSPLRKGRGKHVVDRLQQSSEDFLSIDIANIDRLIGIEVDGPGHFVCLLDKGVTSLFPNNDESNGEFLDHEENRFNGPTLLKHRLLTHLGWNIIHIPYWEYQSLGGDKNAEIAYCRNLLNQHTS